LRKARLKYCVSLALSLLLPELQYVFAVAEGVQEKALDPEDLEAKRILVAILQSFQNISENCLL